jgi:hypothetical protein
MMMLADNCWEGIFDIGTYPLPDDPVADLAFGSRPCRCIEPKKGVYSLRGSNRNIMSYL